MRVSHVLTLLVVVMMGVCVTAQAIEPLGLSSEDFVVKPPPSGEPTVPDPNVILQGGDTCASATVIPGLPYTDAGTTVGYTNDYDEVCPYTGSASPDVVYSFTPTANVSINLTLCTGTTDYDTKMYIYQGSCPTAYVACNDDSCTAPLYPSSYVSALENVSLTGGQTYYIVIDGYGGSSGGYTLDVTEWQPPPPPPECDVPGLLYWQTVAGPSDPWNAFTSGQTSSFDYTVFDDFTSSAFSIDEVHWWGLSLFWTGSGWTACDPTGLTFDVGFYPDNAGLPGTQVCMYSGLTPTMVNTGISYSGYNLYYWEVTGLTPACQPTGVSWMSVKSYANAAGCAFLWMNGTGGNGILQQFDGTAYTAQAYDGALCLVGSGATVPTPTSPIVPGIPAMNRWGIIAMVLLLLGIAAVVLTRRSF